MTTDLEEDYWQAITTIEAQALIEQVRAIQSPNLKPNEFKKYSDQLTKNAYPKGMKPAEPELSVEELGSRIGELLGRRK